MGSFSGHEKVLQTITRYLYWITNLPQSLILNYKGFIGKLFTYLKDFVTKGGEFYNREPDMIAVLIYPRMLSLSA